LLELITVIGIITVLLSLAFIGVGHARLASQRVQCANALSNTMKAITQLALEQHGYTGLVGEIVVDSTPSPLSARVGDVERRRYLYLQARGLVDVFNEVVATPHVAAVVHVIGRRSVPPSVQHFSELSLQHDRLVTALTCPANPFDNPITFGNSVRIGDGAPVATGFSQPASFAWNEAVFGFHHDRTYLPRRMRGLLSATSARVALATDVRFLSNGSSFEAIRLPVSLDQSLPAYIGAEALAGWKPVHGTLVNVLYSDGSVEAHSVAELASVLLVGTR
jgi:prepilin-type processing-associated H-X9-DG protein